MAHRPENPEQRAAFELYFRQGSRRSIERLCEQLQENGKPRALRTLYGWSSRFAWQDRVAEVEGRAAAEDVERLTTEYRAMQERHQQIGLALQKAALERLATLPHDLKPGDVMQLLRLGTELEAKARTQPPAKIDITARVYEMAIREGLDPHAAVLDGLEAAAGMKW